MADTKWSNDSEFPPQSTLLGTDKIVGLRDGANIKALAILASTAQVTGLDTELSSKLPIDNPVFTGVLQGPDASLSGQMDVAGNINANGFINYTDRFPLNDYVSTGGNDAAPQSGIYLQPYRNIDTAVLDTAGSKVDVSPGTYTKTGNFQMRSQIVLNGASKETTIYNVSGTVGIDQTQWTGSPSFTIQNFTLSGSSLNFTPTTYAASSSQNFIDFSTPQLLTSGKVTTFYFKNTVFGASFALSNFQDLTFTGGNSVSGGTFTKNTADITTTSTILIKDFDFGNGNLNLSTTTGNGAYNITIINCRNLNSIIYNDNSASINATLKIDVTSYPSGSISNTGTGTLGVTMLGLGAKIPFVDQANTFTQSNTFSSSILVKEISNPLPYNLTPVPLSATSGTITAAQLTEGCLIYTGSSNGSWTLPLGADIDTFLTAPSINRGLRVRIENQTDSVLTILGNTGCTLSGLATGQLIVPARGTTIVDLVKLATNSYTLFGGDPGFSVVSVTGTTKTLAITDLSSYQSCNNASTQTITIPLNSSVPFPIGTTIEFDQQGAGQVVIAAAAGVTLNSVVGPSPKSYAQYVPFSIRQLGIDNWRAYGCMTS